MYCTYNTIYTGDKMPPFYIGRSTVQKIQHGYHGTVASKKYKTIWKEELKNNPHLFETTIIAVYETEKEAVEAERELLLSVNAHINPLYINLSCGKDKLYNPSKRPCEIERRQWFKEYMVEYRKKKKEYYRDYNSKYQKDYQKRAEAVERRKELYRLRKEKRGGLTPSCYAASLSSDTIRTPSAS